MDEEDPLFGELAALLFGLLSEAALVGNRLDSLDSDAASRQIGALVRDGVEKAVPFLQQVQAEALASFSQTPCPPILQALGETGTRVWGAAMSAAEHAAVSMGAQGPPPEEQLAHARKAAVLGALLAWWERRSADLNLTVALRDPTRRTRLFGQLAEEVLQAMTPEAEDAG